MKIIYCVVHNLDVEMFRESRREYFMTHESAESAWVDWIADIKETNENGKCKTLDEFDPHMELFDEEPNLFFSCGNGFVALVEIEVEE